MEKRYLFKVIITFRSYSGGYEGFLTASTLKVHDLSLDSSSTVRFKIYSSKNNIYAKIQMLMNCGEVRSVHIRKCKLFNRKKWEKIMQIVSPIYDLSFVLTKHGFVQGKDLVARDKRYADAFCNDYQLDWWWKFAPDPDRESPYLMGEDAHPLVSMCVNPETRLLYCDVGVCGTYHTSGSDLDLITDTIAKMAEAGFLWKKDTIAE